MICLALTLLTSAFLPLPAQDEASTPPIVTLDEDPHQRYILHRPAEGTEVPKDGWKVLFVFPGGDGSAEFAPFVGRIREHALEDSWLVVQVIAPAWNPEQAETLVWPTKLHPWSGMEFTCEELFERVLTDLEDKHSLDPKFLFTLAWSSSGQLAYTLALEDKSPVTGTFVAMSVFKPDTLPSLRKAKGRRFHILHSPEDFIPIAMAEKARDKLKKKGAEVNFVTYAGGHGWKGNVYGMLRTGFEWLDRKADKARAPKRRRK